MPLSPFRKKFCDYLPAPPSSDQSDLIDRMERFLFQTSDRAAFIIRGYAGTGKTTAMGALVKTLPAFRWKTVLLAPTGRAAKVLSSHSSKLAFTIHKKIYRLRRGADGSMRFVRAANLHTNTIFIVDEASMISDASGLSLSGSQASLLDDLVEFVFSGKNCKLVFIGDIAQLPPVGSDLSPALDPAYLQRAYGLQLKGVELKSVLRQADDSGILFNATRIRLEAQRESPHLMFQTQHFPDIKKLDGMELEDTLSDCYQKFGERETIVICRSNKRANAFNRQIRSRLKWLDELIATGDYIMVVKNNYYWLEESSSIGFIANGDIAEVMRLGNIEEMYGFQFVDATLRLVDYPGEPTIETKLILDALDAEAPALSPEQGKQLFERVLEDYADIPDRRKKYAALKKNPYYNALQIKFAYAVTCHKSQGGQWKAVFVDQGYLTEEMINVEYSRWLYTAVTRATDQLYFLNFHPRFFPEGEY